MSQVKWIAEDTDLFACLHLPLDNIYQFYKSYWLNMEPIQIKCLRQGLSSKNLMQGRFYTDRKKMLPENEKLLLFL